MMCSLEAKPEVRILVNVFFRKQEKGKRRKLSKFVVSAGD